MIDEAESMNPAAQNAALKLLEEPPAHVVFLLCAVKPMQLLETVRSRCAALKLKSKQEQDAPDEASRELAAGYLKAVNTRDEAQIFRWCAANEGLDAQSGGRLSGGAAGSARGYAVPRGKAAELGAAELMASRTGSATAARGI